jgi:DNA polymerase III subunit alpha
LFLWNENYLKFKHFLQPNIFIAIRGRIEVPPRRKELEFVVNSIEMLQDLREIKANAVNIKVSSKELTQSMITDLHKLFNEHNGKCTLNFTVFDPLDGIEVQMPARTLKVNPSNELFNELKKYNLLCELK